MRVILLEKIPKLGNLGDMITVKPGHGRNFLIPRGKAVFATRENRAIFEKRRAELEKKAKDTLLAAQARAEALKDVAVNVQANATDKGKLFGSIGARHVVEALGKQGFQIDKHEVQFPEGTIRALGTYPLDILLHPDVTLRLTLAVVSDAHKS